MYYAQMHNIHVCAYIVNYVICYYKYTHSAESLRGEVSVCNIVSANDCFLPSLPLVTLSCSNSCTVECMDVCAGGINGACLHPGSVGNCRVACLHTQICVEGCLKS